MKLKGIVTFAILTGLAAAPALAQKVYIDYDKEYKGGPVKTFQWVDHEDNQVAQQAPLFHSRLVNAIEHFLGSLGIREVSENPDIYVTYHTSTKEEMQLNTSSFGYGYPGAWGWSPYYSGYWGGAGISTSTTSVSTYERGTLIIDVWDAETKNLIWRGSATAIVPENPDKLDARIEKALQKMMKKWEKIKKKEGIN